MIPSDDGQMLGKIVDCIRGKPGAFDESVYSGREAICKSMLRILCIYDKMDISKSETGFVD